MCHTIDVEKSIVSGVDFLDAWRSFWTDFWALFASKTNATSKHAICAKSLQNTAWAHTISSLAFAAHAKMSSQIVEKWYVFVNIDFDSILG